MKNLKQASLATLLAAGFLSGCGTVRDDLAKPVQITCIYLSEPLSHTGKYGLMNFAWVTRLERGPYISERQDEKGTYYRAPPGGILIEPLDASKGTDDTFNTGTRDGGLYIPNDPNETPKIYQYISTKSVPTQIPAAGMNCSDVAYKKDQSTSQITVISGVEKEVTSNATSDLIGRPNAIEMTQGPPMSVAIVDSRVGNIDWSWALQDPVFITELRKLAANKVLVKEIQSNEPSQ